ncbi:GMP synthase [glutamine-hydrolyzing] [Waddlia chondrophila 2032/99]|uniref:GMP synthase (glutamine-hydrolyzing) n=1 Tax=Waddlia chondrophila 2032/99 TaxID=765953 RepID=F8LF56_9BACT|nr:GMP synthase [glutamine-hydrolyzing] [Waddlia chondrophila 2032/99]
MQNLTQSTSIFHEMSGSDSILILDFGSQYTQLIARRIRELGVYTEILPPETPFSALLSMKPKGLILSGSPSSTHGQPLICDPEIANSPIPVLGICYGMQLLNRLHKGTVTPSRNGEYGKQPISLHSCEGIFKGLDSHQMAWMSHGDSINRLADPLIATAQSENGHIAAMQHTSLPQYGVQFHPEVTHTENGKEILHNFIQICQCKQTWSLKNHIESAKEEIRKQVGNGTVISLVSGGVDSTAATFLCFEALGSEKVIPLHIDTGLMRAGESKEVCALLRSHGMRHLDFVDASDEFLDALKGVENPEKKRTIIGNLFIEILEREIAKIENKGTRTFLCQGTLYTDLIESGQGVGKHADVIKTHHNVNPPVVQRKREQGLIVEPNNKIFKDEVRILCEQMGVPSSLAWRHPFPGPGLAIRILGEVTKSQLECLRAADAIYLEEIVKAGLYDEIWQAFACLLPVSTVGVMGDKRTIGQVIALRAVSSIDGMTADFFPLPMELLSKISTRIINEVPEVNRVVYDITSKPPGTIEWE